MAVDGDDNWTNLATVIGRPDFADKREYAMAAGRVSHRDQIDAVLQDWIAPLTPREAQERLQAGGVMAGAAINVKALLTEPHLAARNQLGELPQPGHDQLLEVTMGIGLFENIPEPELRPAPALAAHTREIWSDLLDMSDAEVGELVAAGVLELPHAEDV